MGKDGGGNGCTGSVATAVAAFIAAVAESDESVIGVTTGERDRVRLRDGEGEGEDEADGSEGVKETSAGSGGGRASLCVSSIVSPVASC